MQNFNFPNRGVWNVAYISKAILMKGDFLRKFNETKINHLELKESIFNPEMNYPEMSSMHSTDVNFCQSIRKRMIFMFVSNLKPFGYLVNKDDSRS